MGRDLRGEGVEECERLAAAALALLVQQASAAVRAERMEGGRERGLRCRLQRCGIWNGRSGGCETTERWARTSSKCISMVFLMTYSGWPSVLCRFLPNLLVTPSGISRSSESELMPVESGRPRAAAAPAQEEEEAGLRAGHRGSRRGRSAVARMLLLCCRCRHKPAE